MPPVGMSMKKNPSEDRIRLEKYQDLLQTTHHSSGHLHHLSRGVHLSLHSQDHEGNDRIFPFISKNGKVGESDPFLLIEHIKILCQIISNRPDIVSSV